MSLLKWEWGHGRREEQIVVDPGHRTPDRTWWSGRLILSLDVADAKPSDPFSITAGTRRCLVGCCV